MKHEEVVKVLEDMLSWEKGTYYKPGYKHPSNQRERIDTLSKAIEWGKEVEVTDKLLNERNKVLDLIPECSMHGKQCLPHIEDWIKSTQTENARLRLELDFAQGKKGSKISMQSAIIEGKVARINYLQAIVSRVDDVEGIEKLLNEVEGLVYLENSKDRFDITHADVMKNNHKASAKALRSWLKGEK